MKFRNVQPGLLPAGTETPFGTVVRSSLTAYLMDDGAWVSFDRVHGAPKPASPLVVFR